LLVDATRPITDTLSNLANIFTEAGWIVASVDVGGKWYVLRSPYSVGGRNLYVRWSVSDDEEVADVPQGNYKTGLLITVGRRLGDNPPATIEWLDARASTIFQGGVYYVIVNDSSFVIVPPELQTYRYQFGTWCSLLIPTLPTHPAYDGDYVPFVLFCDRWLGKITRDYPHTQLSAPTRVLQLPNGEIHHTTLVAHVRMGKKYLFARERNNYISPLAFLIEESGYYVPLVNAPHWFVEINPAQPMYIPTEDSLDIKNFLTTRYIFGGRIRVVPCGLLPPDGAKLLVAF